LSPSPARRADLTAPLVFTRTKHCATAWCAGLAITTIPRRGIHGTKSQKQARARAGGVSDRAPGASFPLPTVAARGSTSKHFTRREHDLPTSRNPMCIAIGRPANGAALPAPRSPRFAIRRDARILVRSLSCDPDVGAADRQPPFRQRSGPAPTTHRHEAATQPFAGRGREPTSTTAAGVGAYKEQQQKSGAARVRQNAESKPILPFRRAATPMPVTPLVAGHPVHDLRSRCIF